jgi:hypothetical protein
MGVEAAPIHYAFTCRWPTFTKMVAPSDSVKGRWWLMWGLRIQVPAG